MILLLFFFTRAIFSESDSVNVVGDEADILCLHLHHMTFFVLDKNILMSNMKIRKSSGQHVTFRTQNVVDQ